MQEKNLTIVTGIWNLKRETLSENWRRPFQHYIDKFIELLKIDNPMFIYIEPEYEHLIWQYRNKSNTYVKHKTIEEFKTNFIFYNKIQEIRNQEEWRNKNWWIKDSTQANLELYNPMVMSKMFMLNDAKIYNPFHTDYFFWIDGGITNTVHEGYFTQDKILDILPKYLDKFTFICFPYDGKVEIHGFDYNKMCEYSQAPVEYVARGGMFGGPKETISSMNSQYYNLLKHTLDNNLMGTEESIFTIMSYLNGESCNKYFIKQDGLLYNFCEDLKNNIVLQKDIPIDISKAALYVIGFNFPKQFESLLLSFEKYDSNFLSKPIKYLLNNSTDRTTDAEYERLCKQYNFIEIKKDNIGISRGRQFIAEHFMESSAEVMFFFQDDMFLNNTLDATCRNGFPTKILDLYYKTLRIVQKEKLDYLKLSFTELYGDHTIQWAWYNIPADAREQYFPQNTILPVYGHSINPPKLKFTNISVFDGLSYATGDIFYSDWPQVFTRKGTQKLFIDNKNEYSYEQVQMAKSFLLSKQDNLNTAILLASPIFHHRFEFYEANVRREN